MKYSNDTAAQMMREERAKADVVRISTGQGLGSIHLPGFE